MYLTPQKYECPKCEINYMWSEHHDPLGFGIPYCLSCYDEFLKKNIPIGELKK